MFIELSGTPGSGKSFILAELCQRYTCQIIEDNYVESLQNIDLKILSSILGTLTSVTKSCSSGDFDGSRLTLVERGLFDRIAWARLLAVKNERYVGVAQDIEMTLRESLSHIRVDLIVLMLTSYGKVRNRRQGNDQHPIVNPGTIEILNAIYSELYDEFNNSLHIVKLDDRDYDLLLDHKLATIMHEIAQLYTTL